MSGAKASSGASACSDGGGAVGLAARRRGARGLPDGNSAAGGAAAGEAGRGWRGMGDAKVAQGVWGRKPGRREPPRANIGLAYSKPATPP